MRRGAYHVTVRWTRQCIDPHIELENTSPEAPNWSQRVNPMDGGGRYLANGVKINIERSVKADQTSKNICQYESVLPPHNGALNVT